MNLIIFGPPGAGKGTQANFISKKFNLFQLSTGDLLRSEIKKKTELGKKIEKIIFDGSFVTDDIINSLLKKLITNYSYRNKIIFDGYPRTISQAKNLDQMLKENNQFIDLIIFLNVKKDIIEKRLIGRVICEKCNLTLNEFFNKDEINSHICGKEFLKRRKDDNQETIIRRYDEYIKKTKPVLDFYSSQSNFHEIEGSQKIEEIKDKIEQILAV